MIRIQVFKSVEVDSYAEGCLMEGGQDFGVIQTVEFSTLKKALEFVATFGSAEVYEEEEGRMEVQAQENEDGYAPTAAQWNAFKNGEMNLYLARYSFYFEQSAPIPAAALVAALAT
jgi:hypothetical protein